MSLWNHDEQEADAAGRGHRDRNDGNSDGPSIPGARDQVDVSVLGTAPSTVPLVAAGATAYDEATEAVGPGMKTS